MAKAIFYDPQRKRWKRLRRMMDVLGLAVTLLIVFFLVSALSGVSLTTLKLGDLRRPYKALQRERTQAPEGARGYDANRRRLPPNWC